LLVSSCASEVKNLSGRRRWLQYVAGSVWVAAMRQGHAGAPHNWPDVKARIRSRYRAVPQLSVSALRDWLRDSTRVPPLLLDIRTPEEFADGHIEGAVRVDSVGEALRRLCLRPTGVSAVLYCSVGHRSSALADALVARSAGSIYNLEGSLFEWVNEGHAVVASDGRTSKVHPYNREWGVLLRRELWSREP
jgi:rhodanese-related sulfurtransferase